MTTEKIVVSNYTDEQTAKAVEMYQAGTAVEAIALAIGKSARSVVAKLSREKVYVAKTRATVGRVTKSALVAQIAAKAAVSAETLQSLEKATHEALEIIAAM